MFLILFIELNGFELHKCPKWDFNLLFFRSFWWSLMQLKNDYTLLICLLYSTFKFSEIKE